MEAISLLFARARAPLLCALALLCLGSARAEDECLYGMKELWSSSLRNSPITATPLLFDVDGDGYKDIVAPSFSGEVWAVHGESGHVVDNWPFYLDDRGFHASPLVYDINSDGVLDFLLSTTDAEIIFVQPDGILLHGETIKLPPLRVQREWYNLDPAYLAKIAEELSQQINNPLEFLVNQKRNTQERAFPKVSSNVSLPFSEYESRYGRHADPLYSRRQPERRLSGVDLGDPTYIYVDPHILATPTLVDTDGDGLRDELVIPVSYYFDPYYYGEPRNLAELGGLEQEEVKNFVAGGIVVVNLNSGSISHQRLLGITEASASQPGYMLAMPTVVRLFPGKGDIVIVVGSVTGELHMLNAKTLESVPGFPVHVDSISAQVAVADLVNNDSALEMVVGDGSGNIYCIDRTGRRLWEVEGAASVISTVRFIDVEGDGSLEVVAVTRHGTIHVLHGNTGEPYGNFPIHLSAAVQSSVLLTHLNNSGSVNAPSIIVPSINTVYIIDMLTGCIDTIESEHMFMDVLCDDVDPFNPGLEILVNSLDGTLACYSPSRTTHTSDYCMSVEAWQGEGFAQNSFTHKNNSFVVVLPHSNLTTRDITGRSFTLTFELCDNGPRISKLYTLSVSVGRRYMLYNDRLPVYRRRQRHSISISTPSEPLHGFLLVQVCNEYLQCESFSYNVRFNLHFEDRLKWFLSLPFFCLCAMFLWLLREEGFVALPTAQGTRKDL